MKPTLLQTAEHKLEQINNIGFFLFGFFCGITKFLFGGGYWTDTLQAAVTALFCAIGAGAGNELWKFFKRWWMKRKERRSKKPLK